MLLDATLLLVARDEASPDHETACAWLEAQLNGLVRVGLPWASLVAFLRVAANPRSTSSRSTPKRRGSRSRTGSRRRRPGWRHPDRPMPKCSDAWCVASG